MNLRTGMFVSGAVVLLICLCDHVIGSWVGLPRTVAPLSKPLDSLPTKLGDWVGTTAERDPEIDEAVGAESIVNRVYSHSEGVSITAHVAAWPEYNGLPHRPQECHTGAGYAIENESDLVVDSQKLGQVPVRLMKLRRSGSESFVLYWYQLGPSVVLDNYDLRSAHRDLRGQATRPPLVKVMLNCGGPHSRAAESNLADLAGQLLDWLASE